MSDDISILYGKVNKLSERVTEIEVTRPFLQEMIDRNIASNERLAETLNDVRLTMAHMNDKMDEQSATIQTMKEEFEESNRKTNERIGEVDRKIESLEEKGKFDIIGMLKVNFPWIVVILGLGIAYASQYFKF